MSEETEFSALQMYKNYIDDLASFFATNSMLARKILTESEIKYSSSYEVRSEEIDDLLRVLTQEQKKTLGYLLLAERDGGIHDTLHSLGERMDDGLILTFNGESVPTGLCGDGLKGDYVQRHLDYDWPNDLSQASIE